MIKTKRITWKTRTIIRIIMGLVFWVLIQHHINASENFIGLDSGNEIENVNQKIFGNNLLGYDPASYQNINIKYYGYSDYGSGIWSVKWQNIVKEPIQLAKDAGLKVARFPGGCGSHHYDWKQTIGQKRIHFLYGLDEFLKTCEIIGAEPVITVSYFTGNEKDAADLVEYLNSKYDGTHPWAAERAKNGHKDPYNVKYFEIGNEVYHGDHRNIKQVLPQEYAYLYLKYFSTMKAVDPSIRIGAVLQAQEWNLNVMNIVRDSIDFGIIHTYPSPDVKIGKLATMSPKEIFGITLAIPIIKNEHSFKETLELLKIKSGKDVPLAITEYNSGFVQNKPVPYRHSLGTALLNAEMLHIFLKPENDILMANYWEFANEYWGMIANGFDGTEKTLLNQYYKRPNYYVFELYHKHFGGLLLKADVKSEGYSIGKYDELKTYLKRIKAGTLFESNLLEGNWQVREYPGVTVNQNDGVLQIDFENPMKFDYFHATKGVSVEPGAYYKLSGYIRTDNLIDNKGVCLEIQDARGWNAAHSAETTDKITGTTDWQYVETVYKALPDAKAVNVIARRIGEVGPLHGKVFFRDVKLQKFVPSLDIKIPYLSVTASKASDGNKIYLMVINKNLDKTTTSTINLKNFIPATKGIAWVLNGPFIDATNETKHDNVKVMQKEFSISSNVFEYTFEPHSLTAIEIDKKNEE
ncbi:MAG: hypothetical protein HQL12_08805 [Candidatus Omnitrophica bacterium]|nr:hypothetical protein [Candidatus Omnitrophota bacterium]